MGEVMNHLNLKTALTAVVLAIGSPTLVACSDAAPPGDVESTGTLNAALLTIAADGATYQFPAGTSLVLSQGSFNKTVAIDGDETALSIQLPAGAILIGLQFPNGTPQLRRTLNGVTTLVDAAWVDTQPVSVPIVGSQSTDVTLHFTVTGLVDVTFDMGTLNVALEVQRLSTAQPAQLFENGAYIFSSQTFGSSANAAAQAYFAQTNGDSHTHAFDFNFTGPWQQTSTETICAPIVLDAFSTQDGESGFSRATNLALGGTGTACITDVGPSDQLLANVAVQGPPPAALQAILPSASYRFFVSVAGDVGPVYDGHTFQQSKLEIGRAINGGVIGHQIFDLTANDQTLLEDGSLNGSVRFVP